MSRGCAVLLETLLEKDPEKRRLLPDIMLNGPNDWFNKDFDELKPYAEPVLKPIRKSSLQPPFKTNSK